jgi:hypothetical protein
MIVVHYVGLFVSLKMISSNVCTERSTFPAFNHHPTCSRKVWCVLTTRILKILYLCIPRGTILFYTIKCTRTLKMTARSDVSEGDICCLRQEDTQQFSPKLVVEIDDHLHSHYKVLQHRKREILMNLEKLVHKNRIKSEQPTFDKAMDWNTCENHNSDLACPRVP